MIESEASNGPDFSSFFELAGNSCSDFFEFDPFTNIWTELTSASIPSGRFGHGFRAAASRLYVHAGYNGGLFVQNISQYHLPFETQGLACSNYAFKILTLNANLYSKLLTRDLSDIDFLGSIYPLIIIPFFSFVFVVTQHDGRRVSFGKAVRNTKH